MLQKNIIFALKIDIMSYEICITQEKKVNFYALCCGLPLADAISDVNIIHTQFTNFWNATSFILDKSKVSRINKIQIVSNFLSAGGNIEFDGHLYRQMQEWNFWKYLLDHKYISKEEFDNLN